jgi:alpha-galactosidase
LVTGAVSLDNGLGLTPQMGYNTWNDFRCDGLTASSVQQIADRIVELGLDKLGYRYLNIDDCWSNELSSSGQLIEDPSAFPDGMRALVDYVHARGLFFGIYTCRGTRTCAFRPGSKNLEHHHAEQFASWGIDYVKEDSCFASNEHHHAFDEYATMRDALNSTGRPIFFSLCGWNAWYAPRGASLANSWRIAPDCDEWANVYVAIRTNEQLAAFAGPGGWNDPDMLVGSDTNAAVHLSPQQVQTQFSMWAVMASPLLIGSSILHMPPTDLATYSNDEVIRIDQDPLGVQGEPVWSNCPPFTVRDNWWMSPWSMPQDVVRLWTIVLVAMLLFFLALGTALVRRLRGLASDGRPLTAMQAGQQAALLPEARALPSARSSPASTSAGRAPTAASTAPATPPATAESEGRRGRGGARCLSSRFCLVALLFPLVALGAPALVMLVAIHVMKPHTDTCQQVWARPLADGAAAICMVNFAPESVRVACDRACMARVGFEHGVHVRDVVSRRDMGTFETLDLEIPGDGGSVLLRVLGKPKPGDDGLTGERE